MVDLRFLYEPVVHDALFVAFFLFWGTFVGPWLIWRFIRPRIMVELRLMEDRVKLGAREELQKLTGDELRPLMAAAMDAAMAEAKERFASAFKDTLEGWMAKSSGGVSSGDVRASTNLWGEFIWSMTEATGMGPWLKKFRLDKAIRKNPFGAIKFLRQLAGEERWRQFLDRLPVEAQQALETVATDAPVVVEQ